MPDNRNNEKAIAYAEKFKSDNLVAAIRIAEKDKLWGTLYYTPNQVPFAEFVFQDGICLRAIEPKNFAQGITFNESRKFW